MRLFLSYARGDASVAAGLAEAMRRRGFDVFIDQDRLRGGDDFVERLAREIETRDGVVLLLTPAGTESRWVQGEAAWALQCGKKIIPVVLDGTSLIRFLFLSHVQQVRLTGRDDEAVNGVAEAVATIFGPITEQRFASAAADPASLAVTIRGITEDNPVAATALAGRMAELDFDFLSARHAWEAVPGAAPVFPTAGMTAETIAVYRQAVAAYAARAFDVMETLLSYGARRFGLTHDPLALLDGRPIRGALAPYFKKIRTLQVKGDPMSFSRFGTHLIVAATDDVKVVDVRSGAVIRSRYAGPGRLGLWLREKTWMNFRFSYSGRVRALGLSPREDAVVFGRDDGRWGIWSLREDSVCWLPRMRGAIDFAGLGESSAACHVSNDPYFTAVSREQFPRTRRVCDRNSREPLSMITASRDYVFTARSDRIRVWGEDDEGPLFLISTPGRRNIYDLDVTPDGRYLAAMLTDGCAVVWTVPDMQLLSETVTGARSYSLRISPDTNILYTYENEEIRGIDRVSGKTLLQIACFAARFAVSPVGDLLAVEGDGETELWGLH